MKPELRSFNNIFGEDKKIKADWLGYGNGSNKRANQKNSAFRNSFTLNDNEYMSRDSYGSLN